MGEWATPILEWAQRSLTVYTNSKRPQHASKLLEFEHAAILRDRIKELQQMK